jgi:hypothetical protein
MLDKHIRWYRFIVYNKSKNEACIEGVALQGSKNQNLQLMRVVRRKIIYVLTA